MDDKGYAFTPLAFLLMVPVVLIAVSFGGIVDELNTLSALFIGGDVTATIASDISTAIKQDVVGAGRGAALIAVETVVNNTRLGSDNHPFFSKTGSNTSRAFIIDNTIKTLNNNITQTCRVLENETGRSIYIKNKATGNYTYIDPSGTDPVPIFQDTDLSISQNDPFGFNITVEDLSIMVVQNSNTSGQSVDLSLPGGNYYITIEGMEDPYIWVNSKERNSSIIYGYSYYYGNYHFADNISESTLNYLNETFLGLPNSTIMHPYYFQDPEGMSFFDRLENNTNSNSDDSVRMSTFMIWDPLAEDHGFNVKVSMLDTEYFKGTIGDFITTTKNKGKTTYVLCPNGKNFVISNAALSRLGLQRTYTY